MLAKYQDKSAYAMCIYAFCESPIAEPRLFIGKCEGLILAEPRGQSNFGWDPIFVPNGYS